MPDPEDPFETAEDAREAMPYSANQWQTFLIITRQEGHAAKGDGHALWSDFSDKAKAEVYDRVRTRIQESRLPPVSDSVMARLLAWRMAHVFYGFNRRSARAHNTQKARRVPKARKEA
ncbi:hypothetical protein ANO14919_129070 [Xylariales sp. No.14919]|nr:hypothetical protein ANO14919_129070 [Xylariales sp. No.14919]